MDSVYSIIAAVKSVQTTRKRTMTKLMLLGIVLIFAGLGVAGYGIVSPQFDATMYGEKFMQFVGGGLIAALVGILLVRLGRPKPPPFDYFEDDDHFNENDYRR